LKIVTLWWQSSNMLYKVPPLHLKNLQSSSTHWFLIETVPDWNWRNNNATGKDAFVIYNWYNWISTMGVEDKHFGNRVHHWKCGVMCWMLLGCVLATMPTHLSMHCTVTIPIATAKGSDRNDSSDVNITVSNLLSRDDIVTLSQDERNISRMKFWNFTFIRTSSMTWPGKYC